MDLDPALEGATCFSGGCLPRSRSRMTMLYASRPFLEAIVRELLREDDAVELHEGTRVTGLVLDAAGGADGQSTVIGVEHLAENGSRRRLAADFVVDAAGRGSKAATWMGELGSELDVLTLDARVSYSSRLYRWPDEARPWWKQLTVFPDPDPATPEPLQYLCSIFPIENDSFIAVMGLWGLKMPTTNEAFEEVARQTRAPEFARALAAATPLTDVHHTKATSNVWRRFDRLSTPPRQFLAVGDAVCAFNPIYGQGMSCASAAAVTLQDLLVTHDPSSSQFPKAFYAKQARFLETPWALALTRDGGYEHATGTEVMPASIRRSLLRRYTWSGFEFITEAGWGNPEVDEHFARLFNIQESLDDFLRNPRVLVGLATYGVRKILRRGSRPPLVPPHLPPSEADYSHLRYPAIARTRSAA